MKGLRCNACGQVFTAQRPGGPGPEQYGENIADVLKQGAAARPPPALTRGEGQRTAMVLQEDSMVRIEPADIRKKGKVPKNRSLFFTIFQTFLSGPPKDGKPCLISASIRPISFDFQRFLYERQSA